jgi:hypothetical protein
VENFKISSDQSKTELATLGKRERSRRFSFSSNADGVMGKISTRWPPYRFTTDR